MGLHATPGAVWGWVGALGAIWGRRVPWGPYGTDCNLGGHIGQEGILGAVWGCMGLNGTLGFVWG